MNASTIHPARPLFDSNFVPGILTRIVLDEHEREPGINTDAETLKIGFAAVQCVNVGRIIDSLEREQRAGRSLLQIGSGSIDLQGALKGEFSIERALQLQELYIGSPKHRISPLSWLAYLLRGIDRVPSGLLPSFDMVCGALADFDDAAATATPCDFFEENLNRRPVSEILADLKADRGH